MSKDFSDNIFDHASKISKGSKMKKEKGDSKKKKKSFLEEDPSTPISIEPLDKLDDKLDDKEFNAQIERVKEMHKDLLDKMDETYSKLGVSSADAKNIIEDRSICSDEQRDILKARVQKWSDKLYKTLGGNYKEQAEKKNIQKGDKKRKRKTLGARKGWIQM